MIVYEILMIVYEILLIVFRVFIVFTRVLMFIKTRNTLWNLRDLNYESGVQISMHCKI